MRAEAVQELLVDEPETAQSTHERRWRLVARTAAPDASWKDGRVRPSQAVLARGPGPADNGVASKVAAALARHHGDAGVIRLITGNATDSTDIDFERWT